MAASFVRLQACHGRGICLFCRPFMDSVFLHPPVLVGLSVPMMVTGWFTLRGAQRKLELPVAGGRKVWLLALMLLGCTLLVLGVLTGGCGAAWALSGRAAPGH